MIPQQQGGYTPETDPLMQAVRTVQGNDEAAKRSALVQALMQGHGGRPADYARSGTGSIMGGIGDGIMQAARLFGQRRAAAPMMPETPSGPGPWNVV